MCDFVLKNYFNKAERDALAKAAAEEAAKLEALNAANNTSSNNNGEMVVEESSDAVGNDSFVESEGGAPDESQLDESQFVDGEADDDAEVNESTIVADPSTDDLTRLAAIGDNDVSPLEIEVPDEVVEDDPEDKIQYSTTDGVELKDPPSILTAELHEHQVISPSDVSLNLN